MANLDFLQAAVQLGPVIDAAQADMIAAALAYGVDAPQTVAAADQFNAALDAQLLNIYMADEDYDYE